MLASLFFERKGDALGCPAYYNRVKVIDRSRKESWVTETYLIQLLKAFDQLPKQGILGEVADAFGCLQHACEEDCSQPDPLLICLSG